MDPLIGTLLGGRYLLTRFVNGGGMGRVYEAEDTKTFNKIVAIKLILQGMGTMSQAEEQLWRRFQEEAQLSVALSGHPRIIQVTEYGIDNNQPYIVMEFLNGRSLSTALQQEGPFRPDRVLAIALQICDALRYAHGFERDLGARKISGVIHRDIKPSNIFLIDEESKGESVKVLDFGIAKAVSDVSIALGTNQGFIGSLGYASPEQIVGEGLDARADIYALGVVLYQMLTGKLPLNPKTNNFAGWYHAHISQKPIPFEEVGLVAVPSSLAKVIMSCLEKEPARRPESMKVLSQKFQEEKQKLESLPGISELEKLDTKIREQAAVIKRMEEEQVRIKIESEENVLKAIKKQQEALSFIQQEQQRLLEKEEQLKAERLAIQQRQEGERQAFTQLDIGRQDILKLEKQELERKLGQLTQEKQQLETLEKSNSTAFYQKQSALQEQERQLQAERLDLQMRQEQLEKEAEVREKQRQAALQADQQQLLIKTREIEAKRRELLQEEELKKKALRSEQQQLESVRSEKERLEKQIQKLASEKAKLIDERTVVQNRSGMKMAPAARSAPPKTTLPKFVIPLAGAAVVVVLVIGGALVFATQNNPTTACLTKAKAEANPLRRLDLLECAPAGLNTDLDRLRIDTATQVLATATQTQDIQAAEAIPPTVPKFKAAQQQITQWRTLPAEQDFLRRRGLAPQAIHRDPAAPRGLVIVWRDSRVQNLDLTKPADFRSLLVSLMNLYEEKKPDVWQQITVQNGQNQQVSLTVTTWRTFKKASSALKNEQQLETLFNEFINNITVQPISPHMDTAQLQATLSQRYLDPQIYRPTPQHLKVSLNKPFGDPEDFKTLATDIWKLDQTSSQLTITDPKNTAEFKVPQFDSEGKVQALAQIQVTPR